MSVLFSHALEEASRDILPILRYKALNQTLSSQLLSAVTHFIHHKLMKSNADRASWWELMVLASHVHPSVATMARTLLSGANIVYNGNPSKDLSLTAFLDKFMEKKSKQTTWHDGFQIEPAKKLDMSNHLIGLEILSWTKVDVPLKDLVFHKFYMNKMNTSQPKKKKKKNGVDDEAVEELFEVDDSDEAGDADKSDNEEIENMLDSTIVLLKQMVNMTAMIWTKLSMKMMMTWLVMPAT